MIQQILTSHKKLNLLRSVGCPKHKEISSKSNNNNITCLSYYI